MIDRAVIEDAKNRLLLPDLLRRLGFSGNFPARDGQAFQCIWPERHRNGDRNPSANFFNKLRGYKCHAGCSQPTDGPGILAETKGVTKGEGIRLFIEMAGSSLPPTNNKPTGKVVFASPVDTARAAEKAERRELWPEFTTGTLGQAATVAKLRSLPLPVVREAISLGVLYFCKWKGHPAYVIRPHDGGSFASARRLDGRPWQHVAGEPKNLTLPGSECRNRFLAVSDLGQGCPILLTEGSLGCLETLAALMFAGMEASGWLPFSAFSCNCSFESALLNELRGRHVRIVPDNEEQGLKAAARWAFQLRDAGCRVSMVRLPEGAKDLGDVIALRDELGFEFKTLFA